MRRTTATSCWHRYCYRNRDIDRERYADGNLYRRRHRDGDVYRDDARRRHTTGRWATAGRPDSSRSCSNRRR